MHFQCPQQHQLVLAECFSHSHLCLSNHWCPILRKVLRKDTAVAYWSVLSMIWCPCPFLKVSTLVFFYLLHHKSLILKTIFRKDTAIFANLSVLNMTWWPVTCESMQKMDTFTFLDVFCISLRHLGVLKMIGCPCTWESVPQRQTRSGAKS